MTPREWELGPPRGTTESIPFPGHRTLAEAWADYFSKYRRGLEQHRKPRANE